jgi:hypothetical protein
LDRSRRVRGTDGLSLSGRRTVGKVGSYMCNWTPTHCIGTSQFALRLEFVGRLSIVYSPLDGTPSKPANASVRRVLSTGVAVLLAAGREGDLRRRWLGECLRTATKRGVRSKAGRVRSRELVEMTLDHRYCVPSWIFYAPSYSGGGNMDRFSSFGSDYPGSQMTDLVAVADLWDLGSRTVPLADTPGWRYWLSAYLVRIHDLFRWSMKRRWCSETSTPLTETPEFPR